MSVPVTSHLIGGLHSGVRADLQAVIRIILNFHTVFVLIPNSTYSLKLMQHDLILNLYRVSGLSRMFFFVVVVFMS